jgi:hypothetical protein
MAYNNRNLLERIVEIQKLTREHKEHGATQRWIYDHVVRDRYHISMSTYNNYLCRNARRELRAKNPTDSREALPLLFPLPDPIREE